MDTSSLTANELLRLCSDNGSPEAWREFVRRFQRPISLAVLRTVRFWGVQPEGILDDMVQDTFVRLCADNCRLLKGFVPREEESAIGFLKMVATNITHDRLRAENTQKRGGTTHQKDLDAAELDGSLATPAHAEALERSIQRKEVDRALQSLIPHVITERDRSIFWLYFHEGYSAREISEMKSLSLTVKGVESTIHRTTQQVRDVLSRPPAPGIAKGNPGLLSFSKERR